MSFRDFEVKNKPLFASMKRAKEALELSQVECIDVGDFFDFLEDRYGDVVKQIEYVSFYDYVWKDDNQRYTIAYIYTKPSLFIRDKLFDDRVDITIKTGWYPMVSGSRASFMSVKAKTKFNYQNIMSHRLPYVYLGMPISLQNIAMDNFSTALLLKCEKGNILLDTGFGVDEAFVDDVDIIFISHFHKDHTGGLFELLRVREIPVILSGITLDYLLQLGAYSVSEKERLIKNSVLIESLNERANIVNALQFFMTYHCPGSYGVKYIFKDECFIYPGDICLSNGFYDFKDDFVGLIDTQTQTKMSIIVDCAIVPKSNIEINTYGGVDFVKELLRNTKNNQAFISKGSEMLFNVYLSLFEFSINEHQDWLFIVNDELYRILQSSLRNWLMPGKEKDLFIKHVLKNSKINFAETQRLYRVSDVDQFYGYSKKPLMFLMTESDLNSFQEKNQRAGMDIENAFFLGPIARSEAAVQLATNCNFKRIYGFSSSDWCFHSDKESIRELLYYLIDKKLQPILFHAFPKALRKFMKEFPEEQREGVGIVSKTELLL